MTVPKPRIQGNSPGSKQQLLSIAKQNQNMKFSNAKALLTLLTLPMALPAFAQGSYTIRELSVPGSTGAAKDIDNLDRIAGEFQVGPGLSQGFIWQNAAAITLPSVGGALGSGASCISDGGFVGGRTDFPTSILGAAWKPVGSGSWASINMAGIPFEVASEVNDIRGNRATGYSDNGIDLFPVVWPDIAINTSPVLLPLPAATFIGGVGNAVVANGGIVGAARDGSGTLRAAQWKLAGGTWSCQLLPTLGTGYSRVDDVVSVNHFVGTSKSPLSGQLHLVEWVGGILADLGTLPGKHCYAEGSNASGIVVGSADTGSGTPAIAIAKFPGQPIVQLSSLLPPQSAWQLNRANSINDRGVIVGQGKNGGIDAAYALIPTQVALSTPIPGIAGTNNLFTLTGCAPAGLVRLHLGLTGGSTLIAGCLEGLDIAQPRLLGTAIADPAGAASINVAISAALAGVQVYLQAYDYSSCHTSNVVVHTF
jgi:uncharacterized membrane protein